MVRNPYRILIIDDSMEDRRNYVRLLSTGCEEEYQVTEAATAAEGKTALRQGPFECILLDYRLPDRDGVDLLPDLLGRNLPPQVAIVMLTGHGDEVVAVQAMKRGVQDYLVKDRVTGEALRRAVQTAVEKVALLHQIEKQRLELKELAITDGLTGLYNRRYFMERLEEEIQRARRYLAPASLLLLDLDLFKGINDRFGHLVGDKVLQTLADMLKRLRATDFAARYGGDEFCVLLTNTDLPEAELVANRLCETVAAQVAIAVAERIPAVTISIGIAQCSEATPTGEDWIALADDALYQAKKAGRNQVCCPTVAIG